MLRFGAITNLLKDFRNLRREPPGVSIGILTRCRRRFGAHDPERIFESSLSLRLEL